MDTKIFFAWSREFKHQTKTDLILEFKRLRHDLHRNVRNREVLLVGVVRRRAGATRGGLAGRRLPGRRLHLRLLAAPLHRLFGRRRRLALRRRRQPGVVFHLRRPQQGRVAIDVKVTSGAVPLRLATRRRHGLPVDLHRETRRSRQGHVTANKLGIPSRLVGQRVNLRRTWHHNDSILRIRSKLVLLFRIRMKTGHSTGRVGIGSGWGTFIKSRVSRERCAWLHHPTSTRVVEEEPRMITERLHVGSLHFSSQYAFTLHQLKFVMTRQKKMLRFYFVWVILSFEISNCVIQRFHQGTT